jgi:hypothetical protein
VVANPPDIWHNVLTLLTLLTLPLLLLLLLASARMCLL